MKNAWTIRIAAITAAIGVTAHGGWSPVTNDLWDVSQGIVVTASAPMNGCYLNPAFPFDVRDIFGGHLSAPCNEPAGRAIFADGYAAGFVHFVEWRTPTPVAVRSFNLFAGGDGGGNTAREFASFRLLAKSSGSSVFDLELYSMTPTHPYTYVGGSQYLVVSTDITPVTSQEFRAEFVNRTDALPSGPRIIELDGFSDFLPPALNIRVSEVEVFWSSVAGRTYQLEYCLSLASPDWIVVGLPVVGDGNVVRVQDKILPAQEPRFYRVRATQ